MTKLRIRWATILLSAMLSGGVYASSEAALPDVKIDTSSAHLKNGAVAILNVCTLCHSVKYVKYRSLLEIGFSTAEVDTLRGEKPLDEPFLAKLQPESARKVFGMVPPDLSDAAKTRKNGAAYVYALLTSYHEDAQEHVDNKLFPGIKMPDPLGLSVELDPARKVKLDQRAKDIAAFLQWSADPRAAERESLGVWVLGYLAVLTFLLWLVKRRVWQRLKAEGVG